MPQRIDDITCRTFGRLTVLQLARRNNGRTLWLCRCECGVEKVAAAHDLKQGKVASCGCLRKPKRVARRARRDDPTEAELEAMIAERRPTMPPS
jgi:hypothetical protein